MRASLYGAGLLVLAFAQRFVLAAALKTETYRPQPFGFARWTFHNVPVDVLFHDFHPSQAWHAAFIVVALLQSCVLFLLARELRAHPPDRAALGVLCGVAAVLAGQALFARQMLSSDVYAYAGYAKLGLPAAYAPPNVPFAGSFHAIDGLVAMPLPVCFYGPVWLALAHAAAGSAPDVVTAIVAFRVLGLVSLAAIVFFLLRMRYPAAAIAAVALNPAIYLLFVADAHNDIVAVAFVVAAMAVVRRSPPAAAVLVACAGLVKLPFAAFALLVFAGEGALWRRAAYAAGSLVLVMLATQLLAGPQFFTGLIHRLSYSTGSDAEAVHGALASFFRRLLAGIAVFALVSAFIWKRYFRGAALTFVALSALIVQPWYLITGLPYAAYRTRALVDFCVCLPLAAALFEGEFASLGTRAPVTIAIALYAIYTFLRPQWAVDPSQRTQLSPARKERDAAYQHS